MSLLVSLALTIIALLPSTTLGPIALQKLDSLANLSSGRAQPIWQPPSFAPVPIAQKAADSAPPSLSAPSFYAVDVATGSTLASNAPDTERPIASITKLATAVVIVHNHDVAKSVDVPALPAYQPGDEIINLTPGEQFTYKDLLAAMLINSADDAADALALADSDTQAAFVAKMNRSLGEWGITGAHFSNPSGLVDSANVASARAVAQIAQLALYNPTIKQLVSQNGGTITDASGRQFALTATDQLLQNGQFQGIKTGYTAAAGQCFVGLTNVQGHQVITVVLGSSDRFGDTLKLTDWIDHNYQWHAP